MRLGVVVAFVVVFGSSPLVRAECALPAAPARATAGELEAVLACAASCYFPGLGQCLLGKPERGIFFFGAFAILEAMLVGAIVFAPPVGFTALTLLRFLPGLVLVGVWAFGALDAFREGYQSDALLPAVAAVRRAVIVPGG